MTTAKSKTDTGGQSAGASNQQSAQAKNENSLMAALDRRKIEPETWKAVCASVFPGAKEESILLAFDYCKARGLDIMKKPCHIVNMSVKDARSDQYVYRDVIMPGISELRMTAFRTGEYMGQKQIFGETKEFTIGKSVVNVPEFCTTQVMRLVGEKGEKREVVFEHTEYFVECCATKKDGSLNSMWEKRPRGQMAKCSEAGALRKAFPEQLGSEYTADEMEGKTIIEGSAADSPDKTTAGADGLNSKLLGNQTSSHLAPDITAAAEPVPAEAEAEGNPNSEWLKGYDNEPGATAQPE